MDDPYDALGLARDATPEQIKAAHRKGVKANHPDQAGGDRATFDKIQRGYEVLINPERRKRFDETGDDGYRSADAHRAAIMARINLYLAGAASQPGDIDYSDLKATILRAIAADIETICTHELECMRQVKRLKTMRRRFKIRKPRPGEKLNADAGLVDLALAGRIYELERALLGAPNDKAMLEQVAAAFKALDYEVEQTQGAWFTTTATSTVF